jgi:predicted Zn-dependent peptidase
MSQTQPILSHVFENGLTLIAQPMPWLESAAITIATPAGCRFDPPDKLGLANMVSELMQRGCGQLDSRAFIESFELLGVDFGSSVSTYKSSFSGSMPASQLLESLGIFADLVLRPHLPESQFEDARLVCSQEIKGLEDDLSQKVVNELKQRHYGTPDGYCCEGTLQTLGTICPRDVASFYDQQFVPNETIIACAGKLDWENLVRRVESLFSEWSARSLPEVLLQPPRRGYFHMPFESEQTHIAVAFPGVSYADPDYYKCRGAIGVLSGGFSSRLFTEIREKRGLCYTVYASCNTLKEKGAIFAYSGTSTDRAQATLDVLIEQIQLLHQGIFEDELQRLKIQIRTSLVAQQESCRSRANSIASDWLHLGTARTLQEVTDQITGLTVEAINDYLADHKPQFFDIVTLGELPLQVQGNEIPTAAVG